MTVDLRFAGALGPQPGGAVTLVFGGSAAPPDPPDRPVLHAAMRAAWRPAAGAAGALAAPWRLAAALGISASTKWRAAVQRSASVRAPWASTAAVSARASTGWVVTGLLPSAGLRAPWSGAAAAHSHSRVDWHSAQRAGGPVLAPWQAGRRSPAAVQARWHAGQRFSVSATVSASRGLAALSAVRAPWQGGEPVSSVGGPWTPYPLFPEPETPCYQPDPGGAVDLLFRDRLAETVDLLFSCRRPAVAVVPIRRVYMVTNVTTLVRVSDNAPIPCLGMTISLDVDSWAWGFSASLPASALSLIEPGPGGEPVELAATLNGTEFRLIAESLSRERVFGSAGVRVQGRGKTAVLDAPYAQVEVFGNAAARTSQQLVDEALPPGWTADWNLTAWLVPGGVWTHQGTPISAALSVAAAAGAYLLPHASASSFKVLPRYPVAPWEWGSVTPDLELPSAVVTREGIEWAELPRYNRVFVSGSTTGGKLVQVTRGGTAGDVLAPMVTDSLITHTDAGRQRGLAVLARTGRWADVTLRLPVLPETNVIRPGIFVRYTDGAVVRVGLVRSVNVDVQGAQVWQTIKVESYVN